jgi:hypothetical protein
MKKAISLIFGLSLVLIAVIWLKTPSAVPSTVETVSISQVTPSQPIPQIAQSQDVPAPAVPVPAKPAQFREFLKTTLKTLPTEKNIPNDEHLHHRPEAVANAAVPLGQLARLLTDNSLLIPDGIKFYRACAEKSELLTSVRALCLRNWIDWSKKIGMNTDGILSQFPAHIQYVAKEISRID